MYAWMDVCIYIHIRNAFLRVSDMWPHCRLRIPGYVAVQGYSISYFGRIGRVLRDEGALAGIWPTLAILPLSLLEEYCGNGLMQL
jgi:hypothetical protein